MASVGIIGATGYVGTEIVRLLQNHPDINITSVVSHNFAGQKISDIYPNLKNVFEMECDELDIDKIADKAEVFVTALPHGISKEVIPKLVEKGKRIVDHSGDFRYKSVEVYEKWYNATHGMPHLLKLSAYGLPELHREEIKNAQIIGNPGCYPTCSILALAPLVKNRLVDTKNIIIDAASGVSGAGRKTDLPYQFCECDENFKAYSVSNHRHTSEIEQELSLLAEEEITVSFTPHLVPMKRGMLATIYANLNYEKSTSELIELYKEYYKNEYFVRILDEGKLPETKFVAGSNFIDIGLVVDKRLNRVVILSAIDNLGKGAAGQAVQVLNILFGLPEHRGLTNPGFYL
ncbi:N-acetyl-gamma-glutamyl-phosphate reductase [Acetivibrio thermocellus AD2]|jgi:N-acetyl-gamma-glutamyl-phosphate reductase|uniref:N-acetyl-gamma-glutamyl-phosphate reductase n=1 Tax=Acetivibrio thermocellus AD2 TaxID=1138384 RepID=A0AB36TJQ4_ACETH|nr:N-acetyl-gamma-glutamyl-phosphate reductase [Acetivibrio thermocellus]ADU75559.1 N-acetyl-gamma-glutamyl-phosphate reductase [Acetivibrio thermocellus DSM 1313]ALX09550.1 N-acetyl-gamma-glutamyl-phosphate reductase [Acetivibrio thermocellus AD2]ANV77322.1 N-acetyl-gamma-glutamyl-phosphate reductase [Acetivibrio thermocellus DSM 2360]EIC04488.1 N-acetyl-gamma-glutamyl-phosphate reductase [Acetivibrio thermocellus YS]PFH03831.1 N-acetyl-gamma-glutamyl-phosphate reductase [Acetivibrio thermoce